VRLSARELAGSLCLALTLASGAGLAAEPEIVAVQVPVGISETMDAPTDRYVDGCRIVRLTRGADGWRAVPLTPDLLAARDPAVSFDGQELLFAAKATAADPWQLWRMDRDGGRGAPLAGSPGHAVSPLHVGSIFHLDDETPTPQIVYVGSGHGWLGDDGQRPVLSLYAARADGSRPRRISFNLASDLDPDVLPNGRVLFSSGRTGESEGSRALVGVNIDGTDLMAFAGHDVVRPLMTRVAADGRVYFIESAPDSDGGSLSYVSLRRPMHTRRVLARAEDGGLYHSPCPLPDGGLLASYRPERHASYSLVRLDPDTGGRIETVYADAAWHTVDAQVLAGRPVVRGRSSVVNHAEETGVFYCLDSRISNRPEIESIPRGTIRSLRVIEGLPRAAPDPGSGAPSQRVLGTAPVEADGSFHIEVPARTPLAFQLLDHRGIALASQRSWTWVMPRERRGCVGCHEDRELAPPNVLARAVTRPATQLTRPREDP